MPEEPIKPAQLDWDDNGQPISRQYNDVYFSSASGIDETRYVFLEHNHLPARWQKLNNEHFTIAETGFGSGLNFLAAAQLWLASAPTNCQLRFVSVEKYPLSRSDLQQALSLWPELDELTSELLDNHPPLVPGFHRLYLCNNRIQLTLLFGDAVEMFSQLKSNDHPLWHRQNNPRIDAWFLDGFAPSQNPQMWSEELFQCIADLSNTNTTFATFTAAGAVRRGLQNVGFSVEKVAGFGHKREMLRGAITDAPVQHQPPEAMVPTARNSKAEATWYLNTNPLPNNLSPKRKVATVIGGGIAGCSAANSLAKRGWQVTLIERHGQIASEASGNPQGIIYPKFSKQDSALSRYGLSALLYASHFYRPFWQQENFGDRCGVLLLPENSKQQADFSAIGDRFSQAPELLKLVTTEQIKQLSGLPLESSTGLFCPNLGWVVPPLICRELVNHENIQVVQACADNLQQTEDGNWVVENNQGEQLAISNVVILACSHQVSTFQQSEHLPLKSIRGQITQIHNGSEKLNTVVCGSGYIAPACSGSATLGATYNLNDSATEVRDSDHQTNLQKLLATDAGLSEVLSTTTENVTGRVGFRCTTPDYLPIVGPVPVADVMQQRFELLKKNARAHIPLPGEYHPGLYISCGYGSRGLSYAPLAAEVLAAQIHGEPAPVGRELIQALNPARFLIRNLKRT